MSSPVDGPARVLVVCTGNICRSPMAERLLQASFPPGGRDDDVVVGSAGTVAWDGEPMQPFASLVLQERELDAVGFGARRLRPELVREAALVLGAGREHRAAVVSLVPRASARTFTIRELARLCEGLDPATLPDGDPATRLRALVRTAAGRRGRVPLPDLPEEDDVPDPVGGPAEAFRVTADLLARALAGPVALVHGAPPAWPGLAGRDTPAP